MPREWSLEGTGKNLASLLLSLPSGATVKQRFVVNISSHDYLWLLMPGIEVRGIDQENELRGNKAQFLVTGIAMEPTGEGIMLLESNLIFLSSSCLTGMQGEVWHME